MTLLSDGRVLSWLGGYGPGAIVPVWNGTCVRVPTAAVRGFLVVPTFGGIELLDDESTVASGAAFNLDRASRGDGSITVGGLHYEVRQKGRVVVTRGATTP